MPFVRIQLKEGRSAELKKEVADDIIKLIADKGMASAESVRVIYEDMKDEDYHSGENK